MKQLTAYQMKIDASYDTIQITETGLYFLDDVITHFEYFSYIFATTNYPYLFDEKNSIYRNGKFVFEKVIEGAMRNVKQRCSSATKFYKNVFKKKLGYDDHGFLKSPFAFRKFDEKDDISNYMFHTERIIYSHIDYLDVYRRYVINLIDKTRQCEDEKLLRVKANEKIIGYIKDYMDMFAYYDTENKNEAVQFSEQTNVLCEYFDCCIEEIEKSEYEDFHTPINRDKGRLLLIERKKQKEGQSG